MSDYKKLKVTQLRELCVAANLNNKGKKQELIHSTYMCEDV